ncbi:hypothetical protein [Humisphaera borealis]|uniref:DUF5666 domain-containing protein n=1 Tax=Humisphaera borealis TaxID=2807512 RepID=A0A7M2X1K7_9BACT|nr:hypothetical protein [Humisphaera borealis]QOV91555.1 hypothetical protein IPV69_09425 [Humisphaera borealis]
MTIRFTPAGITVAIALLICAAGRPAVAQDKYTIGLNVQPGQSWTFDNALDSTMNIKTSAQGQVNNVDNGMAQKRVGTITVRDAVNGRPSAITVAFGKECSSSIKANGQEQSPPFPLAGQTVTLKMGADGTFSHDFKGNLDPAVEAELKQMVEFDGSMYPPGPVAVGDEWVPRATKLKEQLQLAPNDKLDIKCKLLAVGAIRGIKTYDISATGSVTKAQDGMQMTIRIGGVTQLELGSGLPVQNDVVVAIGITGAQQAPGADGQPVAVTINGTGQVKMTGMAMPKEGFGGGGPVAVGPPPGPGPQPNPLDPQPNPLDPKPPVPPVPGPKPKNPLAAAESPFTGSFKGRQLSAEFKIDDDKMTGSIKLGPKSFPAVGKVEGAKLVGSFEADGAKFEFVATLEGTTLSLDSEGNKYTLQKDAAAAPAPPSKPKNPLE